MLKNIKGFFLFFQFRQDGLEYVPKLQSHRGYCQPPLKATENTLASIQKSYEFKYAMVEFDIRLTKDNKVILFHDDVVQDLKISNLTLPEIRNRIHVDLLQDIFEWYNSEPRDHFKLNIEIKSKHLNGHLEKETYALIVKYRMQNNVLVSSFNPVSLAYFNFFDSTIFRSLLLTFEKNESNNVFIQAMALNFIARPNALHLCKEDWDRNLFQAILDRKIPIVLWTCNNVFELKNYFNEGINGIISDEITPSEIMSI